MELTVLIMTFLLICPLWVLMVLHNKSVLSKQKKRRGEK